MTKLIRRIAVLLGAPTVVHPDGKVFVRVRDGDYILHTPTGGIVKIW